MACGKYGWDGDSLDFFDKQVKEHVMESITMFAKTSITKPMISSLGVHVSECPDFRGLSISLYSRLLKRLVKSEVELDRVQEAGVMHSHQGGMQHIGKARP